VGIFGPLGGAFLAADFLSGDALLGDMEAMLLRAAVQDRHRTPPRVTISSGCRHAVDERFEAAVFPPGPFQDLL
jgi:hypothetical protein